MERSENINELATALAKAQGAMTAAPKLSTNPYYHAKYADLAAIWDVIRKPLSDNGLSVIQGVSADAGDIEVETLLLHVSGQFIKSTLKLQTVKRRRDNDAAPAVDIKDPSPQGVGSAITYGRRYSLAALIGVVADEDDDGEQAMARDAKGKKTEQKTETKVEQKKPDIEKPKPVLDEKALRTWCGQHGLSQADLTGLVPDWKTWMAEHPDKKFEDLYRVIEDAMHNRLNPPAQAERLV